MSDPAAFQQAFGAALGAVDRIAGLDRAMARALAIHRNTSAKAAQDALADNYPVIRALTGSDAFAACAAVFVETHPPQDSRLCHYGDGFASFLAVYAPFADLPYLQDVARLEQLVTQSLFAADAVALDGDYLAGGLDLELPLRLHPATCFGDFDTPAPDIWRAHQDDAEADALEKIEWRPGASLVTRPVATVEVTPIDSSALAFLQACAEGRTLGEAGMAATGADLAELFSTLITAGAFA